MASFIYYCKEDIRSWWYGHLTLWELVKELVANTWGGSFKGFIVRGNTVPPVETLIDDDMQSCLDEDIYGRGYEYPTARELNNG